MYAAVPGMPPQVQAMVPQAAPPTMTAALPMVPQARWLLLGLGLGLGPNPNPNPIPNPSPKP